MRTMADDVATMSGSTGPAAPSGKPALALPTTPTRMPRLRARVTGGVVGAGVLLAVVLVAVFTPRGTGTVADVLPREAVAFLSVRGAAASAPSILPRLLEPFSGLTMDDLAGARDVTYALFPGASPAEPVPALLVRGLSTLDLAAAPNLTTVPLADGTLVVAAEQRGRVTGFGRSRWSSDAALRALFRGLPAEADILVGLRASAIGAVLQAFAPHTVEEPTPLVLAVRGSGDTLTVDGRVRPVSGGEGGDVSLLGKLPATSIWAAARADLNGDLAAAATGGVPEALAVVLRAARGPADRGSLVEGVLAGPWAFAVLPSGTPGVRDAVVVAPLRGDDPSAALRGIEGAFLAAGPYLTGMAVPEAVIEETARDGVTIRYVNFGSPARSVDYAVVQQHLVVATSRNSMYAAVDTLRGAAPALAAPGAAAPGTAGGVPLVVRPAAAIADDVPEPYRVLLAVTDELRLTREASGRLRGTARLSAGSPATAETPASPAEAGLRAGIP